MIGQSGSNGHNRPTIRNITEAYLVLVQVTRPCVSGHVLRTNIGGNPSGCAAGFSNESEPPSNCSVRRLSEKSEWIVVVGD
jgi:hypothetical protein